VVFVPLFTLCGKVQNCTESVQSNNRIFVTFYHFITNNRFVTSISWRSPALEITISSSSLSTPSSPMLSRMDTCPSSNSVATMSPAPSSSVSSLPRIAHDLSTGASPATFQLPTIANKQIPAIYGAKPSNRIFSHPTAYSTSTTPLPSSPSSTPLSIYKAYNMYMLY